MKEKAKKYIALTIIIVLASFIIYALLPFINGFAFSIVFFFLLSPIHKKLIKKFKINKRFGAFIIIFLSIIVLLLPILYFGNVVVHQSIGLLENNQGILQNIKRIDGYLENIKLTKFVQDQITSLGSVSQKFISNTFQVITNLIINVTIMYFLLYYLFAYEEKISKVLYSALPFSRTNKKIIKEEFKRITYSTIIGTGMIAIIQGTIVGIGFGLFGIKNAIFWGFMCIVLSSMPVIGAPLVWIPGSILQFINGNINASIGIFIFGFFPSIIDNILRPVIQKKIANIHPLISLLGIVIGVPYFGFVGIIIGPLLLSYLLLGIKMVNEEYI